MPLARKRMIRTGVAGRRQSSPHGPDGGVRRAPIEHVALPASPSATTPRPPRQPTRFATLELLGRD